MFVLVLTDCSKNTATFGPFEYRMEAEAASAVLDEIRGDGTWAAMITGEYGICCREKVDIVELHDFAPVTRAYGQRRTIELSAKDGT